MRILRNIAVWCVTSGLVLFAGNAGWSQQGNGLGSAQTGGMGSQQNGGMGGGIGSGQGTVRNGSAAQTTSPGPIAPLGSDLPRNPQMEQEQAKMRNLDRQKRLAADTDKLLALATELKAQVAKSNKDTLSLDVVRKADEIEKLAHSVKEKMKGS